MHPKTVKRKLKFPHCPSRDALAKMTVEELTRIRDDGFAVAHYAARMGCLDAIPYDVLGRVLDVVAVTGDTPLHLAMSNRRLRRVPSLFLNESRLARKDAAGSPLIHLIARGGMLHYPPIDQITAALVFLESLDGDTLLHVAAANGQLPYLANHLTPESSLLRNKDGDTPLHLHCACWRIGKDMSLPASLLTAESILAKNGRGESVVSAGAYNLDRFPSHLLTTDILLQTNSAGDTVLHQVAAQGRTETLPQHAREMDVCHIVNRSGDSPLHSFFSGNSGCDEIPSGWATPAGFASLNHERRTPLHIAASHGVLDSVPAAFLTPRALTQKDHYGRSPLQEIASAVQYGGGGANQIHAIPEGCLLSLPVFLERAPDSQQSVVSLLLCHGYVAGLMEMLLRHGYDAASYDAYIRAGHAPDWPELSRAA